MSDTFPRQYARTQRLTLGEPRTVTVSPDGQRVVFARSRAGDDPVNCLWRLDVATGEERLVADPTLLLAEPDEHELPAEERARRERAREGAGGVVAYATDRAVTVTAFALGGRLFVAGLLSGMARELVVPGPVYDPRPDPTARRLAYVRGRELVVAELTGSTRVLAADDDPDVSWGSADFVAAEEMGRHRGYWWSPDGTAIAACRVDTSPVGRWWISDPAHPERPPTEVAYPAAGTDNPIVTLHVLRLDGTTTEVQWDRQALPYLAEVRWATPERLLLLVQSRDQRRVEVLDADPASGRTTLRWADEDEAWVELVAGTPAELADGRLVTCADRDGARRLLVDGEPVTPPELQVRSVVSVDGDTVVVTATPLGDPSDDPTVQHVWRWQDGELAPLTTEPGVHTAWVGGGTVVVRRVALGQRRATVGVLDGPELASYAEEPLITPNVTLARLGERRLATAVLLPHGVGPDDRLPVLLDPYGGPHAQRVLAADPAYWVSQWFADQGFAVVVTDGRGTPGRGPGWERAVHRDLATPALDDQIDALHATAAEVPQLDLDRVAIRGWSFGGYLAALAVLRRPDVFHAAIAGAPVTEWRLYDTHYTERYLGDPNDDPGPYDRCSLVAGLVDGSVRLTRPLLLVHGLADDNVVAAHTLQLSSALLAAGCPHEVLPLSGVTHMTPQPAVAEHLLGHQLHFLRRALGT
jgi:dipeptidyl-peptidase-4